MDKRNIAAWPALYLKFTVSKQSVWSDRLYIPSRSSEELLLLRTTPHGQDELTALMPLLRACAKNKDLHGGSRLHDHILQSGLLDRCSHALVTMYAKCGELAKASELFDMHKSKDVFTWNALIAGYAQKGKGGEALDIFERMRREGIPPNAVTFICTLKACGMTGAVDKGEQIENMIAKGGFLGNNIALGNALLSMYAKCAALEQARRVLRELPARDVVSWNAMIAGYAQHGDGKEALHCFEEMQHERVSPDVVTFISVLKACCNIGAADKGEKIHHEAAKQGWLANNAALGNALVDMYAKCGAFKRARQVLKEIPVRTIIAWNALIAGYTQHGKGHQALICFERMQYEGLSPNAVTFLSVLKACGSIGEAIKGEQIHDELTRQGMLKEDTKLCTALVDMYAKCGALTKARQVLKEVLSRNTSSWNALIAAYAQQNNAEQALNCYAQMKDEGCSPDVITFICILKACSNTRSLEKGRRIHDEIDKQGLLGNDLLGNALVDMYAKCGALAKARDVFEDLPVRDVLSWSALIEGYATWGDCEQALSCLEQMQHEAVHPNSVTFISILKACGVAGTIEKGKQCHDEITKRGLLANDSVLSTAIVDMYAKCGALGKARRVLEELSVHNTSCWNALIAGYAQHNDGEQALDCFEKMKREGLRPNRVTYICILRACSSIAATDKGERIHDEIAKEGLLAKDIVLGTAVVDMYAKCGTLGKARQFLEDLPARDAISWNALIAGHAERGDGEQALACFKGMQHEGLSPDGVTYLFMLKAFASTGAVDKGEQIHDEISKQGLLKNNLALGTALVEMYAQCGRISKAQQVLAELPLRDVISWNALLAGIVQQGECEKALKCVDLMQCEGLLPNAATLSCMLSACSRLGRADEAQMCLLNMSLKYGLKPNLEHYTCMLDLFARAGYLTKAVEVIEKLPSSDCGVWSALLGACSKWGDVNVGRWAFERALQIDKNDATAYVLVEGMYAFL